jgi:hypothetical protein
VSSMLEASWSSKSEVEGDEEECSRNMDITSLGRFWGRSDLTVSLDAAACICAGNARRKRRL